VCVCVCVCTRGRATESEWKNDVTHAQKQTFRRKILSVKTGCEPMTFPRRFSTDVTSGDYL
jgi:hypothetical protein